MPNPSQKLNFSTLANSIHQVDTELATQAVRAVNVSLTLRNWLIGYYISEYELRGADRAAYGKELLKKLSDHLRAIGVAACGKRQLYGYLRFYQVYPQIVRSVTAQLKSIGIGKPLTPELLISSHTHEKVRAATAHSGVAPEKLLNSLSYTHIEQLVAIDDDTKRAFYEVECIRGGWSVRELKRQIGSLYYERSGLSRDKKKLAELTNANAERNDIRLTIRDPYVFEFLGLK